MSIKKIIIGLTISLILSSGSVFAAKVMETKYFGDVNPVSIAAAIAIGLFIINKLIEFFSKRNARKRKIEALKTIISEEIKLNYWVWKQIESICTLVKEGHSNNSYSVVQNASGDEMFNCSWPNDDGGGAGSGSSSQTFPPVVDTMFNKIIVQIAEIDKAFYQKVILYHKSIADLKHLKTLVRNHTDEPKYLLTDAADYVLRELPGIYTSMDDLYEICTGSILVDHRKR